MIAIAALAPLGGCGDSGNGNAEPPPTPPPTAGVELTLDRDTPHPGETIRLTVANHTDARLEYGLAYRLERDGILGWRWINRDDAFIAILKVAEPGKREREEIRLSDDLVPGRYRIVKEFTARPGGRELEASVEFRVASR